MDAQIETSSWNNDIYTQPKFPSITQNIAADIVIIGAGITGLTTALLLAKSGKKVVVIEKSTITNGTTSYSTGFLVSASEMPFYKLIEKHSFENVKKLWDAELAAIDLIEKIVHEEKIDCEFERLDMYYYAKNGNDFELLKKEYGLWKKAGIDCELSNCETCLDFKTKGNLKLKNQGKFNPTKYVLHLAEKLKEVGVLFYENSSVDEIKDIGNTVELKSGNFTITANTVVVATHFPIFENRNFGKDKVIPVYTYAIEAMIAKGALKGGIYEDTEEPYHYLRIDKIEDPNFDRLILGGEDRNAEDKNVLTDEERYKNLEEELKSLLPELKFTVSKKWSGEFYNSKDNFPLIGKTSENVIICTGFSGSGLPTGTMASEIAHDLIIGKENSLIELFDPNRQVENVKPVIHGINAVDKIFKGFFMKPEEKDPQTIEENTGEVISINGRKVAVYKDSDGNITKIDPKCTHLGCIVGWNDETKTWDCPCHGSRFSATGEVENGPANKPLQKIED